MPSASMRAARTRSRSGPCNRRCAGYLCTCSGEEIARVGPRGKGGAAGDGERRRTDPRSASALAAGAQSRAAGGLPIVALVVAGLIIAIATNSLWALDFFHVVGGGCGPDRPVPRARARTDHRLDVDPARDWSSRSRLMPKMLLMMPTLVTMTLGSGFQLARKLGNLQPSYPRPSLARRLLHRRRRDGDDRAGPARARQHRGAVRDPQAEPNGARIGRLMKVFIYTAGITGLMQIATLVIMTGLRAADRGCPSSTPERAGFRRSSRSRWPCSR